MNFIQPLSKRSCSRQYKMSPAGRWSFRRRTPFHRRRRRKKCSNASNLGWSCGSYQNTSLKKHRTDRCSRRSMQSSHRPEPHILHNTGGHPPAVEHFRLKRQILNRSLKRKVSEFFSEFSMSLFVSYFPSIKNLTY